MRYEIRALSGDTMTSIVIEANSEPEARASALQQGLQIVSIAPASLRERSLHWRRSSFSLLLFCQELQALLSAGLSLIEALEGLLEKESATETQVVLQRLVASLREGQRLSAALAEAPLAFPPLFIGMIQAAEGTSDLPGALSRYIDYHQRLDRVRSKIISASIYPVILIGVGGAVTLFLMMYVVPRFASVYQDAGRELPWLSAVLLRWGQLADAHGLLLLLILVSGLLGGGVIARRVYRNGSLLRLLQRLPGVGERLRLYELSRLYLTLGTLLEGGIPVVRALETSEATVSLPLRAKLGQVRLAIQAGSPLSATLEAQGLTTAISLRMLRVGEQTGQMGPMLTRAAYFYDADIERFIDRFTRVFEPALMAAIGLVVGLIVVLLYMPIFDLAGSLQ